MHHRTARLIIRGDVQGVGYRWWVCAEATRLGLAGWVRNRADGSVELIAAGRADAVDQLADACWRGPRAARVVSVERSETSDPGVQGFDARPTV
jgi:acylphosphatase